MTYTALPPSSSSTQNGEASELPQPRKWSFQSDQLVRMASLEEVLAARAYLCFYERVYGPVAIGDIGSTSDNTSNVQHRKK